MTTDSSPPVFAELLDRAMDLSVADLDRFLTENCSDPAMREELRHLLLDDATSDPLDELLDRPAASALDLTGLGESFSNVDSVPVVFGTDRKSIRSIGAYELVKQIGSGGMGRVFLADQQKPVERRVALKLMHTSLASKLVKRRFMDERQIMARLSHPNVAQIFDAGVTEHGHPFLVVEPVFGQPLLEYCDREHMSIRDRLQLFIQVCSGVQHAHLNRILHRDLKPSNVLVSQRDGEPMVKIIDFGIARDLEAEAASTLAGVVSGTPAYMSPETFRAAEGGPEIDTRTDVYSLGVMLCELLVGQRPISLDALASMRDVANFPKPVPPGKILAELDKEDQNVVARLRRISPRSLGRVLSRELDWIVLKAVASDRERRYFACVDLAADLERYLDDRVVDARPPSKVYRLGKMIRQNAGVTWAAVLIIVSLAAGLIARTVEADRARQARAEAERARAESERLLEQERKVRGFIPRSVVEAARVLDPVNSRVAIPMIIGQVQNRARLEFADDPLALAAVLMTLAEVHERLEIHQISCTLFEEILGLRQSRQAAHHAELIATTVRLANCLPRVGRADEARDLLRESLRQAEASASAAGGAADVETLRLALKEIESVD